jgi:hypothetical protein
MPHGIDTGKAHSSAAQVLLVNPPVQWQGEDAYALRISLLDFARIHVEIRKDLLCPQSGKVAFRGACLIERKGEKFAYALDSRCR